LNVELERAAIAGAAGNKFLSVGTHNSITAASFSACVRRTSFLSTQICILIPIKRLRARAFSSNFILAQRRLKFQTRIKLEGNCIIFSAAVGDDDDDGRAEATTSPCVPRETLRAAKQLRKIQFSRRATPATE
jgi:hypothetical protein